MLDTHTYSHPCLPLILRSYALPYTHTHTHTQVAVYWRVGWWWHTPIPMLTLDCLHRYIFLLHVYRSVSLAHMRRYMQLVYLFYQRAKSLLSRDSRIADCTARHPGVERPFSSYILYGEHIHGTNYISSPNVFSELFHFPTYYNWDWGNLLFSLWGIFLACMFTHSDKLLA